MSAPDWYSFYVGRPHGYRAMGSEQSEEEEERRRQNKTKWAILTVSVLDEWTIPKQDKGTSSSILIILSLFNKKKMH